jgi:hypothetical protein
MQLTAIQLSRALIAWGYVVPVGATGCTIDDMAIALPTPRFAPVTTAIFPRNS